MRITLRELLLWVTGVAIGLGSLHWMTYGLGIVVLFILALLILARLESFLPQPYVVAAALGLIVIAIIGSVLASHFKT